MDAPYLLDTSYTITVSDRFEAMDGSRLPAPYVHRFRVRGPRILAAQPINQGGGPPFLTPDARFDLVVDAPLDTAEASAAVVPATNVRRVSESIGKLERAWRPVLHRATPAPGKIRPSYC